MKDRRGYLSFSVWSIVVAICFAQVPVWGQSSQQLYVQKCGRCHVAYDAQDYPAEEWSGIVKSMKAQAGLTIQEMTTLVEYLENESRATQKETFTQDIALGGYLYTEYFRTPEKTKNFDIHYLAFSVSGWVNDQINYFGEFELEHGGKGDNTFVEQAYIDYWLTQNIALKIGAILTPFNRFDEYHDPLGNVLITRPQMSREIGVSAWKDVGVNLHGYTRLGSQSTIGFDLYSINGLGSGSDLRGSRQYRDNNEELAFGGRLNWVYRDFLEVGGSAYRGAWDDNGEFDLSMLGAHFLLRTDLANFYGEWAQANSENPRPAEDGEISGYFLQASRLFQSRYRPAVRWGALDYLDRGDLLGRDPGKGDKDLTELAFAFAYYPTTKAVFKVEYALYQEGNRAAKKDNDQFGLQAAVRF